MSLRRDIVALQCDKCRGSGEVDHREGIRGFVTGEAWGVHMKKCPHCGGVGEVPGFRVREDT